MYDTDLMVSDWLKSVTPEMYQATSAIREVLRHHDGTKGKMLIASVIEQYVASQFKPSGFTVEDMRRCWDCAKDIDRSKFLDFDTWLKCQIWTNKEDITHWMPLPKPPGNEVQKVTEQTFTVEDMREAYRKGYEFFNVPEYFDEWIKTRK